MSVFFSGFMGNDSERGTNQSSENRFAVHAICLSRAPIHSQRTQKKDTHILIVLLHSQHSTSALKSDVTEQNDVICDVTLRKWKRERQILCSAENQKLRFYHTDHSPPKNLLSTKD